MKRYCYAILSIDSFGNLICYEVKDVPEEILEEKYIEIDEQDWNNVLLKMWTGSEWVDNPNYIAPQEDDLILT